MANYVKISTIGAPLIQVKADMNYQSAVEKVIGHWQAELDQVLPDAPDLIVLPEVCDRPIGYPREKVLEYYRERGNAVRDFFATSARKHSCYITYPAIRVMADGTLRNSITLIGRRGETVGVYNKNHLVIEENVEAGVLYGKDAPLLECDFGKVACAVCFDLNFDELRLKYVKARPDLLLFCSMYHGGLMQNYWAYSCRTHFVGAIGRKESTVISPVGQVLAASTDYFDFVTTVVNLDCCVAHLDYNWDRFKAAKAKYGVGFKWSDPGYLGSVLISCEMPGLTIREIMEEFGIEPLDDYMARALAHRHIPGHIEP
ncbi:MAG: carbon-nitrogen hydrolase family protein [bacterium]|jgi:predicted amidohydrolase|nr:carbon-nitrogen hydrolase family protein [bacterium]